MRLDIKDGNRKARRLMFELIPKTDVMPGFLWLNDVTPGPDLGTTEEGSGCVFRGQRNGCSVTLQLTYNIRHCEDVNIFPDADSSSNNSGGKKCYRDLLAWRSLRHFFLHFLPRSFSHFI